MSWPNRGGGGLTAIGSNPFTGIQDPNGNRLPVSYTILQSGIAMGVPPSGVIGVNGALILGSALHLIYSRGAYMYFPSDRIGTGIPAGLYWVVMSSTTVGIIYNNPYTGGKPLQVAVPTPFVATGSAYTQDLTEITVSSVTIPADAMGLDGQLRSTTVCSLSNTANAKNVRERFGGSQVYLVGGTNANVLRLESNIANNGAALQKITNSNAAYIPSNNTAAALSTIAVNTAVDQQLTHTVNLTAATDFAFVDYIRSEVWPS